MKKAKANWGKVILPTIFFVAIATLLILPFRHSPAANPILTNADFETGPFSMQGSVTGWNASANVADIAEGGSNGSTHSAALSAGGDSQGDTLSQTFTTTAGQNYLLQFDSGIYGKRSGAPLGVRVEVVGGGVDQIIAPPEAGTFDPSQVAFQHYQFNFTASGASTTLRFTSVGLGNGSADELVDSVSVSEVNATTDDITICDAVTPVADGCFTLAPAPCFRDYAFFIPNADCQIPYQSCPDNPQGNPAAGSDGFKYSFVPAGTFTENATNGTATLTGHLESTLHPGYGFDISLTFTGRTNSPNGMGRDLGLDPGCYVPPFGTGGPVDPSTWHFYSSATGTLTGTGNYAGATLQLNWSMKFFQVGDQAQSGASGRNIKPGSSGWFSWTVLHQPNNPAFCLRSSSQTGTTADFNFNCENPRKPGCDGQIGDFVWQDNNSNGCQDAGEPGIPNVKVELFTGCGSNLTLVDTKFTDANGKYLFTNLCKGDYTVRFHTPSGFTHTVANASCNVGGQPSDSTDSDCACTGSNTPCDVCVNLPDDHSTNLTIDCGYIPPCTGQIGDFVWQDNNGNGCQDAGEPGIPNVTVNLYAGCNQGGQIIQSTTTDANGKYLFTGLCAGTYTVSFITPNGFTHTVANAGCNVGGQPSDSTDSDCSCTGTSSPCGVCVTLPTNSSSDLTIDCGYIPPCTGTIGDFVWNDTNGNGCQDTNEPGISGVTVNLYSGCGSNKVLVQTTSTDQTGHYLFTGLCAGDYTVSFTTPTGFSHTVANAACNVNGQPSDSTDSDCTCTGSDSPCDVCVTLPTSSSNNTTIDCGYISTCPPCVNPAFGLGAGGGCTVFELGAAKVSITGPAGGILGDICIAPKGQLAMSGTEYVTGTIKLGPGATFTNSSSSNPAVMTNVDLTAAINAAKQASINLAALPCTQTITTIDGSQPTITGVAGTNVICVKDVNISGKQVTINGPPGAKFVFNVTGKFTLTGGGNGPKILAGVGISPSDIIYNLIGTTAMSASFSGGGGGVNCCAARIDGTLLAVNRTIALSPGLVNGEVISGKNISIVSGSSVRCPTCPGTSPTPTPTPTPTATPQTANCTTSGKPNRLVMTYTGGSCASSQNSQGPPQFSVCQKFCCTESNGGLTAGQSAHIIVSSSSTAPTTGSQRFFEGDVAPNGQFTVLSGSSTFGANTYFYFYQGGVLKQKVQLHTSCSAPLIRGETFGGVRLDDYSN